MKSLSKISFLAFILFIGFAFSSCSDDDDNSGTEELRLNFNGLEDLGGDYVYEGWLIVDGSAVTSGVFTVDATGTMSQTTFTVSADDLSNASTFVLTIEPAVDPDPAPSDVHVLAGDFSGTSAPLTVSHGAALGSDFTGATGKYILATPTNDMTSDELSGVWFLDPAAGPGAGLDLPTLPAGWMYEGWAVIGGQPLSTGRFLDAGGADDAAPYSGPNGGPAFPGEDFLTNAPAGLSFPTDLSGATVVISIEPSPDNSPAPFTLKPLLSGVPAGAADHTAYDMTNNAANTNPTGTASR